MSEMQRPSEQDLKEFGERLSQFRSTLPPAQQRILDAMYIAACKPAEEEVQGYGLVATPWGPQLAPPGVGAPVPVTTYVPRYIPTSPWTGYYTALPVTYYAP
ncbi:MAG: hypothetical protein IRZ14_12165 [Chloroflexi bacterium]|jgi:hypothetical protein|nr:hypothetical protein [Chloroflexota bacterium]